MMSPAVGRGTVRAWKAGGLTAKGAKDGKGLGRWITSGNEIIPFRAFPWLLDLPGGHQSRGEH